MPERVWQAYIDMESGVGDVVAARKLYERLLDRTKHVKVWISYAKFESQNAKNMKAMRGVMERA